MAIYSDKVDQVLKIFDGALNPLMKYDNYTYHIQFYIVDKKTQENYTRSRFENFFQEDYDASGMDQTNKYILQSSKLLSGHKFIIAESGKTDDLSIVSLDIKSVPGFGTADKTFAASEEFKLKIREVAGNSLVNKIHLATSMLGYRSYVNTPMFLTIWFTGYNNTNKEIPEQKIKDVFAKDMPEITYQVIAEEVKTNVTEDGTSYDFTLRPITDVGMIQTFGSVSTFKAKEIMPGEPIGSIFKMVEKAKNDELRNESLKDGLYEAIYGTTEDAFQIYVTNLKPNFGDIEELFEIADVETDVEKAIHGADASVEISKRAGEQLVKDWTDNNTLYDNTIDAVSDAWSDVKKAKGGWSTFGNVLKAIGVSALAVTAAPFVAGSAAYKYSKKGIATLAANNALEERTEQATKIKTEQLNKKYNDFGLWPMANCKFEPDTANNVTSILTEIFQICCPGTDYLPTYNFVPEYVTDYKGIAYYRIKLYISYVQIPGLNYIQKNRNEQELLNYALFGPKTIEEAQLDYLRTTILGGALLKKYRWLLNGIEESVINYDTTEDMFWYLNVSDRASKMAQENSESINRDNIKHVREESDIKSQMLMDLINFKLGATTDGSHKDIDINDLTRMVDSNTAELMDATFIRAAEASDLYIDYQKNISTDKQDKTQNQDDKERMQINANIQDSKIGAQNMLSHGQKCELKMKIIGDPYWLSFMSENIQITQRSLPHIIMDIKTFYKIDGNDDPREDESMRMITVYRITDIDSHFEEGKFTQDLHGYIATPFAAGYNPTFYKKIGSIESVDGTGTGTVLIDNKGKTHILKGSLKDDEMITVKMSNYKEKKGEELQMSMADGSSFTVSNIDAIQDVKFIKEQKW